MNKPEVTRLGASSFKIVSHTNMVIIPNNFIMRNYINSEVSDCGTVARFQTNDCTLEVNLIDGSETVWH